MKAKKVIENPFEQNALAALAERLPVWYEKEKRTLPWRGTKDPYDVWISEIMLQQTRVAAVIDYFRRFRDALPDVASLAVCDDERLMKLWEGLGYYSRARNLKKAAQQIVRDFDGCLPQTAEALQALPGIGSYTAGAIASIAFGEPVPAVDGNVLRVCARICGSDADIALPQTKRALEESLAGLYREVCAADGAHSARGRELPGGQERTDGTKKSPDVPVQPGVMNQALMELGALICVPNGAPDCAHCPMRGVCIAEREKLTGVLPVRSPKKPRRIEKRTVLVIESGGRYLIRKRPGRGLLAGLWEFPSLAGHLGEEEALFEVRRLLRDTQKKDGSGSENTQDGAVQPGKQDALCGWGPEPLHIRRLPDAKHIFTHIEWHMCAWQIRLAEIPAGLVAAEPRTQAGALRLADAAELAGEYALPNAFSTWLRDLRA